MARCQREVNLKHEKQCAIHDVIHSVVNIENFLKENDFQLDTYYKTNFKLITEPAFLPNTCYVLGGS